MASISIIQEWRYEAGMSKSIGQDSTHSYFNGAGYNGSYHVAVYKCYTDTSIKSPKIRLRGINDNTNASKYLGAYFVTCKESDAPSSTLIANSNALSGKYQTRIRFGYDFTGSFSGGSWGNSNGSAHGSGTCQESVVIPAGYFFIYIGTATGSSGGNNWSTFGASNNTKSGYAPQITGTDVTYTVTYNANGGSGSTASQTASYGQTIQLRNNGFTAPSKAVHTLTLNGNGGKNGSPSFQNNYFSSWRTGASSGTTYAEGADFEVTADTTLYARWGTKYIWGSTTRDSTEANGYTVTYNANGGTNSVNSTTVKNKTTYAFQGWGDSASATTVKWDSTSTYQQTDNYTAYAIWKSTTTKGSTTLPTPTNVTTSTLTITLNYQGGGTSSTRSSTKSVTKAFKGWGTSASASSGVTGSYTPTSNVTLYAVWGTSTTKYSAISLPTPTRAGYNFAGWATSANATSGVTGSYTPTSDSVTTLYAIWVANGSVCIYVDGEYKMAMVYIYNGSKWVLALPYLYNGKWILLAG